MKQRLLRRLPAFCLGFSAALSTVAAGAAPAAVGIVDDRGHHIELPAPPQRVVSLLPSLTETVCALQACARLVGVDRFSNAPPQVQALPRLGGLEDTQIERIVALKADVVLVAGASRAIDRLEALGQRVVVLEPRSLRDTQRVVLALAQLLGDAPAGVALWQRIESRLAAAAARVPAAWRGNTVYFEVATTPYAAGEASFIGQTLARLGLANVVPASLGPFPQLNPEYVLRAQPQLVMASAAAIAQMPQRPGWRGLRALQQGMQCGFDATALDALLRAGPRLAEGAEAVADCLQALDRRGRR